MLRINKKFVSKMMAITLIGLMALNVPLYAAQTLGELEAEIEQIKEDTAKQLAKQENIEAEKVTTETDIADVKSEMDAIATSISNKQAEINNKNTEIATQNGKIADIQAEIPKVKEDADKSLQILQKATNGNVMVEMVLSPTENSEDNILRRMDSVNTLAEFAGDTILDLVEIEKELQYEKTVLEKDEAELEAAQVEMQTEEKQLEAKEAELQEVLENQTDASAEIDTSVEQAAQDQAILADTLAYYESYGCSEQDIVGSNCGGLGDDDGDGVINDEDSCPNVSGDQADGCPGDDDGDGVNNNDDSCPSQAGNQGNGCPADVEDDTSTDSGGTDNGGSDNGGSSGGGSATSFARPLSHGVITTEFGGYGGHTGTDMDYADYAPILATAPGVVISANSGCEPFSPGVNTCNGGYGNYVMLMHNTPDGIVFSLYGHMSSLSVSQGQTVSQGQQVGLLGDSGNSDGSHLHFEVFADSNGNGLPDDYKTDARYYVDFPSKGVWW